MKIRRLRTAILHVAATARACQEVGPQTVARRGGSGGLYPVALEEGVANGKARALGIVQVGCRQRKRIAPVGVHRSVAPR